MSTLGTLLLTALYLLVPGLLLALVVRVPLVVAVGSSPVLTFGLVAVLSRVASAVGLDWAPVTFLAGTVVTAVLLLVLRLLVRSPRAARLAWSSFPDRAERPAPAGGAAAPWVVLGTTAIGAAVGTFAAVWGMGGLHGINQGFDAIFHVNAVTLISESGSADPASVGAVNHFEYGSSYYPDAFHALAALVADSGADPVPATNALVALVPAVLAAGLAALLWRSGLPRHAAVVPLVAVSIAAFPFDLMWRGPIWPFALGVALIPSFLALLTSAFEDRRRGLAALVSLAAAGLLLVHPSAALGAGVFALAFFGQRWVADRTAFRRDVLPLLVVALVAVVLALPAVVTAVANSGYGVTYDWQAVQTAGTAVGDLLLFNYDAPLPQLWLFGLLVAGVVGLRRLRAVGWWVAVGAFFVVLLVMAASYEGPLVALLTGPWWNDRFRFEGLSMLGIAVVCTHGVVVLADAVLAGVRRLSRAREARPPAGDRSLRGWLAVGAVVAVFALLSQGLYADYNRSRMAQQYAMGTGGSVTPPELAAFDALAGMVEPGETVMNDPSDGSARMWALKGIRPMFGQAVLSPIRAPLEDDQQVVLDRFRCLDSNQAVRDVVDEYDVRHVIIGTGWIIPSMHRAEGLEALEQSKSLRLVYDAGDVRIYEVDLQPLVPRADDQACTAPTGDDQTDSEEGES
jgi:multidrug transporter EmrE-like cation transporter